MDGIELIDRSKIEGLIGAIVDYAEDNGMNFLEISQACRAVTAGSMAEIEKAVRNIEDEDEPEDSE